MGRKVNWEKYNPEFHLQEGEKVIREIRVAKLGINPHLFIILTCITLGIFLFFWQYFRYPRTAKIIILTNTRILSWETTIGSNPRLLRQESYQVSKLSYYQHELVQNKPPCLGLCKCLMNTKPWTTFRVFFSRFPSEMPPSYNKSPALTPAIGTGMRVAQNVYNAVSAGLLGNYISMATNAVKALVNMAKYALELVVRPEILLQGHYIEVDTSDEGSIELIQGFITDMLALYPRRNLLTKNKHEGAVNLEASHEAPLWDKKEDPVNINPQYLQLGPGEVILDALAEPPHITLMDWILAVCTFSLYYFFVIKDVKHYKGALLVTDRRLISIFVHNQHGGMKEGAKYIQMTNSWFFKGFGDSAIGVVKANNCITKCFQETSYNFLMEVGPGTLSIKPNPKNGKARIYAFFGHFYGYNHEQLVNSAQFPDRPGQNAIREGLLLPGEDVLAATGNKTKKDCNFMVTRLCTCGTNPADAKTMMVATTHRLAITMDASNYWEPEIIKYDYFTSLANVSGFQLHELEFSLPCSCLTCKKVEMAHVSIALRRDDYWTIPLLMPETKMSEQSIQAFARVISAAQNTFENMEKGVRSPNLSLARKFSDDDIDRAGANGAGGSGAPSGKSEKDPRVKSMGQEEVKDPRGSIHVKPADDNDNNV